MLNDALLPAGTTRAPPCRRGSAGSRASCAPTASPRAAAESLDVLGTAAQDGRARRARPALEPAGAAVRPRRRVAPLRHPVRCLLPAAEQEPCSSPATPPRRRGTRQAAPTMATRASDAAAGGSAESDDDTRRRATRREPRRVARIDGLSRTQPLRGRACHRRADAPLRAPDQAPAAAPRSARAARPASRPAVDHPAKRRQRRNALRLAWRQRRRVRPRLVLLLDVSRSMSLYSFFYLRLARALCAELADVHCFIFHTRMTGVAEALRDPDPWRSQEKLHLLAAGWAGGTRIGECLRRLQSRRGRTPGPFAHRRHRRQRRLRHRRSRAVV